MKQVILALIVMVLSGCVALPTGPSVPTSPADGKPFNLYLTEDGKCRQLAERQLGKYYDYFSTQEAQYHYDNVICAMHAFLWKSTYRVTCCLSLVSNL